jgi:hypothetical protein
MTVKQLTERIKLALEKKTINEEDEIGVMFNAGHGWSIVKLSTIAVPTVVVKQYNEEIIDAQIIFIKEKI